MLAGLILTVFISTSDHALVVDGDTFHIAGERVRLIGIDAPEADQTCTAANNQSYDCGTVARAALQHIIAGRPLDCSYTERDRYGRPLVTCLARGDLLSVNEQMVMRGWAVAFDYGRYTSPYHSDEDLARGQRLGMWSGTFERPADWRRAHKIPSRN